MILRLAMRNIWRNGWRTGLTMGGIAVGVALLVWTLAYIVGMNDAMIRGATATENGQIQIASAEWIDSPTTRHAFGYSDELLDAIESTDGVSAASPRVHAFGLVGDEKTSVVSRIVGVVPSHEEATTVVVDGLESGRWLQDDPPDYPAPREVVLGQGIARQLDAQVGTELVLFFEASDGSLGNDLLKVVGIVKTGNSAIDRMYAYVPLADLQYAAALDSEINEVAIRVEDLQRTPQVVDRLNELPQFESADADLQIRPWTEVVPQIAQIVELTERSDLILFAIVYLIVAFGIFNTQRMSALERRREFGVTLAIGVSPAQLFGVVLAETILLTLIGAIIGVALGALASSYFVVYGLDLSAFGEVGDFQYMGISFGESIPFRLTFSVLAKPVIYITPVAVLSGLYPAWQSARTVITDAISGRS